MHRVVHFDWKAAGDIVVSLITVEPWKVNCIVMLKANSEKYF